MDYRAEHIFKVLNVDVDTQDGRVWEERKSIRNRYVELKSQGMDFASASKQSKTEWLESFLAKCDKELLGN